MRPIRSWRRLAVLGALAVLLFAVTAEGVLRIREDPARRGVVQTASDWPMRPHALLGWEPYPGRAVSIRGVEFAVQDRYSSLGLLAPEIAVPKPPGTFRVLVLGDSMTEARQVSRDERFVRIAQDALAGRIGRDIEVLNAGRAGYQTDQELLYYESEGRTLGADLVVLALFVPNDVVGNTESGQGDASKPRFVLVNGELRLEPPSPPQPPSMWAGLGDWLGTHLALYRFATVVWHARIARPPCAMPAPWEVFRKEPTPAATAAWSLTERLLSRLAAAVAADGARLAVVSVPGVFPADNFYESDFRKTYCTSFADLDRQAVSRPFERTCAAVRVACLDLWPLVGEREIFYPADQHLTPAGHRFVADQVVGWLVRDRLVPAR